MLKRLICRIWKHDYDEVSLENSWLYCHRCGSDKGQDAPYERGFLEAIYYWFWFVKSNLGYKFNKILNKVWRNGKRRNEDNLPF